MQLAGYMEGVYNRRLDNKLRLVCELRLLDY